LAVWNLHEIIMSLLCKFLDAGFIYLYKIKTIRAIKLLISDEAYDQFMKLLEKFRKDQIEVVADEKSFQEAKSYLNEELKEINEGKASWHTLEEAEKKLDDDIRKHEDHS